MTGVPPASLVFNGRKYQTNLPEIRSAAVTPEQQAALKTDQECKARMEQRANKGTNVKPHSLQVGDRVLLQQKKTNKLSTRYEVEPYIVQEVKGTQIIAENHIHQVCRHANFFKKVPPQPESEQIPTKQADEAEFTSITPPTTAVAASSDVSSTPAHAFNPTLSGHPVETGSSQEAAREEEGEVEATASPVGDQPQTLRRSGRSTRGVAPTRYPDLERD